MRDMILALLLILVTSSVRAQSGSAVLNSPDGQLAITFQTVSNKQLAPEGGQLVYSVSLQGKPLIEPSALRLDLEEIGEPGRKLVMEARAYDDAVAFRYVVPEQAASQARCWSGSGC